MFIADFLFISMEFMNFKYLWLRLGLGWGEDVGNKKA